MRTSCILFPHRCWKAYIIIIIIVIVVVIIIDIIIIIILPTNT